MAEKPCWQVRFTTARPASMACVAAAIDAPAQGSSRKLTAALNGRGIVTARSNWWEASRWRTPSTSKVGKSHDTLCNFLVRGIFLQALKMGPASRTLIWVLTTMPHSARLAVGDTQP